MGKGATNFDKLCHKVFSANGNGNVTVHEYFVPFDKIDWWIYG